MTSEKETSLVDEVGARFDSIFSQDESPALEKAMDENPAEKVLHSPLRDIKSIVLSMDWEITDQALASFGKEVDHLKQVYDDHQIALQLLKILQVVGGYIQKHQSGAHPTAFKLLHTVFGRFEGVTLTDDMPQAEQRRLLDQSVADFGELKSLISTRKTGAVPGAKPAVVKPASIKRFPTPPAAALQETPPVTGSKKASPPAEPYRGLAPHEAFAVAVDEIKNMIKTEFQLLRAELRLWRDEQ